jgi:hypothetical protein
MPAKLGLSFLRRCINGMRHLGRVRCSIHTAGARINVPTHARPFGSLRLRELRRRRADRRTRRGFHRWRSGWQIIPESKSSVATAQAATSLLAELKPQGFEASHSSLYRYVGLRPNSPRPRKARTAGPVQRCPSSRSINLMPMREAEKQTPEDAVIIERITKDCSKIASASEIARAFAKMISQRRGSDYEVWCRTVDEARIAELLFSDNYI